MLLQTNPADYETVGDCFRYLKCAFLYFAHIQRLWKLFDNHIPIIRVLMYNFYPGIRLPTSRSSKSTESPTITQTEKISRLKPTLYIFSLGLRNNGDEIWGFYQVAKLGAFGCRVDGP